MFTQFLDPNYVSAVNARDYSAYAVIMRKADNSGFDYTILGSAAFSATSAFDAAGSAASALSSAQAYTASALAAFTGTANITTLGTIATGTWAATTLAIAHGGTGQTTAAAAINALLPSQTGQSGNFLTTDGTNSSWAAAGGGSGADPTASVGLTAVNGSATTFLRSDGAPAIDVSIAPTWTGKHVFGAAAGTVKAVFKAGASESVDIWQCQNSSGTPIVGVDKNGMFYGPTSAMLLGTDGAGDPSFGFASTGGYPTIKVGGNTVLATSGVTALFSQPYSGIGAGIERIGVEIDLTAAVSWDAGTLATQRFMVIQAPTVAFSGASTATDAATIAITGAPIAGTNATITNAYAIWIQDGISRFDGPLKCGDGITPASMADASAADNTIYYSTDAGKLVFKDSGGVVNNLY